MSCNTIYVITEATGSWYATLSKYGTFHFESLEKAKEWLQTDSFYSVDTFTGCCGVALDFVNRRYRFYDCMHEAHDVGHLESLVLWTRDSPGWNEWDVAYGWGGLSDLVAIVPQAQPLIDVVTEPTWELLFTPRDEWFVGWDPQAQELTYHSFWVAWCYDTLLSVIRQDFTVVDFGIEHLAGLNQGTSLLATLANEAPYPLADEGCVESGVIIDEPSRRIHYWGSHTPASILASIAKAWPGWHVERLSFGYAGHLAATGRTFDTLMDDEKLRSTVDRWGTRLFHDDWIRERRALPIDSRGLRHVRERRID